MKSRSSMAAAIMRPMTSVTASSSLSSASATVPSDDLYSVEADVINEEQAERLVQKVLQRKKK